MKNIILILALIVSTQIFSQSQTRDVVYLKNGSIIKGTITEMNPSTGIKISTADGSIFVYKMDEILKTEKEEFVGREINQTTSSGVTQESLNQYFSNYLQAKRPALKFIGVDKVNGIKREIYGQKVYEIEYQLIMEASQNLFISDMMSINGNGFKNDFSYLTKEPQGWDSYMSGGTKKIAKGQRIVASGTINFEETDNGWRANNFKNKNYKTVSSNYISPKMAEQKKQDDTNKLESLVKAGDWKSADIAETELSPIYYQATHVPIFKNSINKFLTYKLKTCKSCRNDNIKDIDNAIKKTLGGLNRYTSSSKEELVNSPNSSRITFYITNISFKHLGLKENGDDKGFSCTIDYAISMRYKFNSPQTIEGKDRRTFSASPTLFKYYPNKKSAFNGALVKLKQNIHGFMMKYEPYALDIISLEVDKKGRSEKVLLKKPQLFPNIKKGEFIVFRKGELSIKDNRYSLNSSVGKCKFKGEIVNDQITCEINGGKNKKSFAQIINGSDFTAMSSF